MFCSDLLTHQALESETNDFTLHIVPPESSLQILIHFGIVWVHEILCMVRSHHDFIFQIFYCWHIQWIMEVQQTFNKSRV